MRAIGWNRDARRSGLGWLSHSVAGKWRTVYICRYCTAVSRHWALWTQARSCKCDGRERSQLLGVKLARGRVILGVISIGVIGYRSRSSDTSYGDRSVVLPPRNPAHTEHTEKGAFEKVT
jgi:hypothetical protein